MLVNMQQTGTLKKRRRRNLAKVSGLSNLLYNEDEDNFDGMTLFNSHHNSQFGRRDTQLSMSGLIKHSQSRTKSRITRDAAFHINPDGDDAQDDFDQISRPRTSTSNFF
ncbi:unnamed protein product [Orchesella dallaii]|uniref:Uncharacterized protein n=1 Tax=Orchesella dallaii TaxID=48710 RepID=A0ABP1PKV7_9HEXA